MKPMRDEILDIIRAYYDAGHIVNLNADVMAHKIADMIELHWDQCGRQSEPALIDDDEDTPEKNAAYHKIMRAYLSAIGRKGGKACP